MSDSCGHGSLCYNGRISNILKHIKEYQNAHGEPSSSSLAYLGWLFLLTGNDYAFHVVCNIL